MLKKSDFFSAMTQSNTPVWKGDWRSTLVNLQSANIKSLNNFLRVEILNKYLHKWFQESQ